MQILKTIRELLVPAEPPKRPKRPIGFVHPQDKKA